MTNLLICGTTDNMFTDNIYINNRISNRKDYKVTTKCVIVPDVVLNHYKELLNKYE